MNLLAMAFVPHALAGAIWPIAAFFILKRYLPKSKRQIFCLFVLAYLAAFLSHFLLDAIPHYDYGLARPHELSNFCKTFVDALVGTFLIMWLSSKSLYLSGRFKKSLILFGSYIAISPDIILYFWGEYDSRIMYLFHEFHRYCHASWRPGRAVGIVTQISICFICIFVISKLIKRLDIYR